MKTSIQTTERKATKGKVVLGALAAAVITTQASAAALTENVSFDLTDVNFIFGGMVTAGVALYAIKKAKSLLGA